jgi:hypothetical protein
LETNLTNLGKPRIGSAKLNHIDPETFLIRLAGPDAAGHFPTLGISTLQIKTKRSRDL